MITFNQDKDYNVKTLQAKFEELATTTDVNYTTETHLWVSAIFKTIQGEAPLAGYPAVFLRLSGCNRGAKTDACIFCDTQFSPEKGSPRAIPELIEELRDMTQDMTSPLLVITGGEPLLQATALYPFIEQITEAAIFPLIQFETNGDLFKTTPAKDLFLLIEEINEDAFEEGEILPDVMPINFVISPKRTIKEPANGAFIETAEEPGFFVRLLISADPASTYYTIPQFMIDDWPSECFWLSPMTEYKRQPTDDEIVKIEDDIDIEATRRNITRAIQLANMFGYKVSLQAHSYIGIP